VSNAKTLLDVGVLLVNVILMVTVGMELRPQQFITVAQRKVAPYALIAGQVVVPMLGFLVASSLSLSPPIYAGILLLAACPVGDIANFYTLLVRGNIALSVTMNAGTCLLSIVTMSLVFPVYDYLLGERFVFAVPTPELVTRLLLMVVLPVSAGMLLRRYAPGWSKRRAVFLRNVSLAGVAFLVVYVLVTQQRLLAADWVLTALAGGAFMVLALLTGAAIGRLLRLSAADILTCGIVFAVRNVSLAMVIAVTLLNHVEYAVFAVVFFLTEVPLLLALVWTIRFRQWAPGINKGLADRS